MVGAVTVELTTTNVLAALEAVVAERGAGWVYPDEWRDDGVCRYVVDGCPACIVGAALAHLGVPVDVLAAHEGLGVWALLDDLGRAGAVTVVGPVAAMLYDVQSVQDGDPPERAPGTWGEALAAARAAVPA
jgi:hypothetical protein